MEPEWSACFPQRSIHAQRSFLHLNHAARALPRSGFVLPPDMLPRHAAIGLVHVGKPPCGGHVGRSAPVLIRTAVIAPTRPSFAQRMLGVVQRRVIQPPQPAAHCKVATFVRLEINSQRAVRKSAGASCFSPRATTLSVPSGKGRWSWDASNQGAVNQISISSGSVRITGIALEW